MRTALAVDAPILRKLIQNQVLSVCVALGFTFTVLGVVGFVSVEAEKTKMRTNVEATLSPVQETWRAWKVLGLEGPLTEDMQRVRARLGLQSLRISDAPVEESSLTVVMPKAGGIGSRAVPWRVVASLPSPIARVLRQLLLPAGLVTLLSALFLSLLLYSTRYLRMYVNKPLERLLAELQRTKAGFPFSAQSVAAHGEVRRFVEEFEKLYGEAREHEKEAALSQLAAQVSHDIRSPLAALSVAVSGSGSVATPQDTLIRNAITRIQDIASLLLKDERIEQRFGVAVPKAEAVDVNSVLESIVTEKRAVHRQQIALQMFVRQNKSIFGLFSSVCARELTRVLSNLLDNAVEAISAAGCVEVSVSLCGTDIAITVQDSGDGIPPEVLPLLGLRGASFGKVNGNGLGLYHARTAVESWGGKLSISSSKNSGTCVEITLPQVHTPDWFLNEIRISSDTTVFVVDEEPTVHEAWTQRFGNRVPLCHLSGTAQLLAKVAGAASRSPRLILIENEFSFGSRTGIELIKELGIESDAIVVASRADVPSLQQQCGCEGLTLLPKSLVARVAITVVEPADIDSILIDDDLLVRSAWQCSAQMHGHRLECFSSLDEFLRRGDLLSRHIPIFVDRHLSEDCGISVAVKLRQSGFARIFVATGDRASTVEAPQWIAGVLGKHPPWAAGHPHLRRL